MSLRLSRGRRLRSPPGDGARPTSARVRLAVMNMLAARIPGCRWLDLCCGSGVMACEALRRGAAAVVAVERDRRVAEVARANLEMVAGDLMSQGSLDGDMQPRWTVVCGEALRWLEREAPSKRGPGGEADGAFDLIYVDPPYRSGLYGPIAERISAGGWLRSDGLMLWEVSREVMPEPPGSWRLLDQRLHGGTALMVLEPGDQPPSALPRRY